MKLKIIYLVIFVIFCVFIVPVRASGASLTISKDSSASYIGSSVTAPLSSMVDFNVVKLTNNSSHTITVYSIKVTRSGGTDDYFASVAIFKLQGASRTQIGSNQNLNSGIAYFGDLYLNIDPVSSVSLVIVASVSNMAVNGQQIGLGINSGDNLLLTDSVLTIDGSADAIMRTVVKNVADTTPPAAPGNISVSQSAVGESLIKISWSDPADSDLAKISVYRSNIKGQLGEVVCSFERPVFTSTVCNDKNFIVGNTYYYTVKAADTAGNISVDSTQYSGIFYPKGLNIMLDSSSPAANSSVAASSTNATLAVFKFFASGSAIDVAKLKIAGIGDGRNIFSLKLYVGGVLKDTIDNSANILASASQPIDFSFLTNQESKFSIPADSGVLVLISADISSTALAGTIKLAVASLTQPITAVTVYGLNIYANPITITSTYVPPPNNQTAPPPANQNTNTQNNSSCNLGSIPEGATIRARGDIDVYIIKYVGSKKFKRLILSPSVFNNYGHLKWSDIKDVEQCVVDSFTTSELVRAVGDPKVYKLYPSGDTGEKKWVTTADAFLRMGFDWDAIYEINQFDRDSYILGSQMN